MLRPEKGGTGFMKWLTLNAKGLEDKKRLKFFLNEPNIHAGKRTTLKKGPLQIPKALKIF